jgi:oligopeptide transport system permease protein
MRRFIVRRVVQMLLTLIGVSMLLFVSLFVVTDPVATFGQKARDPVVEAQLRERYNLDDPLPVQYLKWVGNVSHGDFGESIKRRRPVNDVIWSKVPNTVKLAFVAIVIELLIGLAAGLISAIFRYSFWDVLVTLTTTLAIGFPSFVLGLMLQYLFGVRWRILPVTGTGPDGWFAIDKHIILPAFTLAAIDAAVLARLMRGTMLEVLRADYVRTARAKGLTERTVLLKHGLRNAIIPIVTYVGVTFGTLLAGTVITESLFNYDGVGKALVDAIYGEDNPIVLGIVTYSVAIFVIMSAVVDLLYGLLDPRIRLET